MPVTQQAGAITTIATGTYSDAVFSSDGSTLYAEHGNTIFIYDVATGDRIGHYTVGTWLGGMGVSEDGKFLAVVEEQPGDGKGTFYQIDLTSGAVSTFKVAGGPLWDLGYLADGTVVVSSQRDRPLEDFNLQTHEVHAITGDIEPGANIVVSADGNHIAAQPPSNFWPLDTYDNQTGASHRVQENSDPSDGTGLPLGIGVTAIAPDGSWAVDGIMERVYNGDLSYGGVASVHWPDARGMVASPDGSSLYIASGDGEIVQYDTQSWNAVAVYDAGATPVYASSGASTIGYGDILQISPDGTHLSLITDTGIQVIDLTKAVPVSTQGDDDLSGLHDLFGLSGNDVLHGEGPTDMSGGPGDDTYYVTAPGEYVDEATDEGHDTVHSLISFTLPSEVEDLVLDGTADLSGTGNEAANAITGNSGANVLVGAGGDDHLSGGAGNDQIDGGLGNDLIDGGAGTDMAVFVEGYDYTDATGVTVSLAVSGAQDTGQGMDTLVGIEGLGGSDGNDRLTGDAGNNTLDGYSGDDWLDGGAGRDAMTGGAGNDTYVVDNSRDQVIEGTDQGVDLVRASISYTLTDYVENLTLTGDEATRGTGNALDNMLLGNSAANVLSGLDGSDSLHGGAGDDKLFGGAGNDTIDGGAGNDRMFGGTGNDVYRVDSSSDSIVEYAGEGTDVVVSSADYRLRENVEKLTLTGSASLWGYGNDSDNFLTGNDGANKLYGLAGNDTIRGGGGNDWIEGGTGKDVMYGGAGSDNFVFRDGDFGGATAATADRIMDFVSGEDHIRLNYVDANTALPGDQAFHFIGTAAFDGTAGELRYQQINVATYISGDTNGDGVADFMIRVDGLHTLSSSDFIL